MANFNFHASICSNIYTIDLIFRNYYLRMQTYMKITFPKNYKSIWNVKPQLLCMGFICDALFFYGCKYILLN